MDKAFGAVSRRGFLRDALSAFGFVATGGRTLIAAPEGWKAPGGTKLVFGAISDTHLRTDYTGLKAARTFPHKYLLAALNYFRSQNVDAVVHCGDAAHRGQIRELEFHADAWNEVFPKNLAPDGHKVEKLFVTGNHEIDGWRYGTETGFKVERAFKDPAERAKRILATDIASSWERVWGEKYEPVWHKTVKGCHFFGRHYGADGARLVELVKSCGALRATRPAMPFFVLSHIRPSARITRALGRLPCAISLFGHWHHSASSWNVVYDWHGTTAIQVPACAPTKSWLPPSGDKYISKVPIEGGDVENIGRARQGYLFRIYDDMMVVERREFGEGGSIGENWIMPLCEKSKKECLGKTIGEPQFRDGARLAVEGGVMRIPLADGNPKSRVYAYEVEVDGVLRKAVYAAGANMGVGHETNGGVTAIQIPEAWLAAGGKTVFKVTPLSSLGTRGRAITTSVAKCAG